MDCNIPKMVQDFLSKCSFDEKSIILEVGTNNSTEVLTELTNGAKIITLKNNVNLETFCKAQEIDKINLIFYNSINEPYRITQYEIFKKTEYIIIHENYLKYFSEILNKPDWQLSEGYEEYVICKNIQYRNSLIKNTGSWNIKDMNEHYFDRNLANLFLDFFKSRNVDTVVDFGCGPGQYVDFFESNELNVIGYDGNELTPEITNGKCQVLDLTTNFNLDKKFDCVLSLEVGEHIPKEYEEIYIDNLIKHAGRLIIISWAVPGQDGYGHVNCQSNEYIKNVFKSKGFKSIASAEEIFRTGATAPWFKNTIMVFELENYA